MNGAADLTDARDDRKLRFSSEDLELFSSASHDRNPLHMSADYARKTPYGDRVVFGALGGLACLSRLKRRPDFHLSEITLDFISPMFMGIDYSIEIIDESPQRATAKIYDGGLLMLKMTAGFAEGPVVERESDFRAAASRAEAANLDAASRFENLAVDGSYTPSLKHLRALSERMDTASRGIEMIHVAALMWCSYLIGMEMPGRLALFSRLSLKFAARDKPADAPLWYKAKAVAFDERFDLLRISAELFCDDAAVASADLKSFIRRDSPAASTATIESMMARSEALGGKVALVIGASRGLGAGLSQFLSLQGCAVLANFHKSRAEAERLKESLSGAPGEIALLQGDGGELSFCREIEREIALRYKKLDLLVCNACPPLLPLRLEPNAAQRINEYVGKSLSLVSSPMSVFLSVLSASRGWCVVISSVIARREPPAEWPHYVSAKYAIEGLVRVAAVEYPAVSFLLVMPPRLLTDLTGTPLGRQEAIPPERVAAKIVRRIMGPPSPGRVETLEDFE